MCRNFCAISDVPDPQADPKSVVCANSLNCTVDHGLAGTIAQFETPMLRDLEDSAPYSHNGSALKFNDVVQFYVRSSTLARAGALRNAPVEFRGMSLSDADVAALSAFLASLTEDYDDAWQRQLQRRRKFQISDGMENQSRHWIPVSAESPLLRPGAKAHRS